MNHWEIRRESEPSLYDLIEERAKVENKQTSEPKAYIDYGLIHRVLKNERTRQLKTAQKTARKARKRARMKRAEEKAKNEIKEQGMDNIQSV